MPRFFLLLLVVLACTLPASAQTRVLAPHKPIASRIEKPIKDLVHATQRSMIGGLWMIDVNLKASIYLRNVVETDSVTVTPVLHLSNAAQYTLPDVTVKPSGVAIISINDGLQSMGISGSATLSGYVELLYTWPWDPFCATVRNVDTAHSLIFTYALRPTMPLSELHITDPKPTNSSHTIEGMWWKQEKNVVGFVTVANLSAAPADTTVEVTDSQAGAVGQHTFTVSPHGMKFIQLPELQETGAIQGGIRITSSQGMDKLVVNGGLEDVDVGYSAQMQFSMNSIETSPTQISIAELGVMAGAADPMMLFPVGTTFTPYSVLRNVSDSPVSVTPTVWWMAGATPHSAQLPPVTLQAYQTQSLDVMSLLSQSGLVSKTKSFNGSFNLVFDGNFKSGALLMSSGSVDQTNTYVFEVIPRGVAEGASKSLQYWSTGNGDDTMVTLWNPADEAQDFVLKLFFEIPGGAGGHYDLPIHIGSRETRNLNISEVVENQLPDAEGNLIPVSVHEGSIRIQGSQDETEHILLAVDSGIYNVRKATCSNSCQECDGYIGSTIVLSAFSVGVQRTNPLNFVGTWNTGGQRNILANWSSNHTPIMTVNTAGLTTGVSVGTATIVALSGLEPIGVGNICTGGAYMCPSQTFGGSSGGNSFGISSVSPVTFTYGGAGTLSITGSGFSAMTGPVAIKFDDPGVTASGSVVDDGHINGTYQVTCGAVAGAHTIWINFSQADGGAGAPSNSLAISVVLPAAPTPTIKLGGNSISGTQSVVVGQQIALSGSESLPACMSKSSEQWTPSSSSTAGTPIGGYSGSATSGSVTALPPNTNSTYTLYWVYPASSVPVTYQYTMSGGGGAVGSPVASATFNITGPSGGSMSSSAYPSLTMQNWAANPCGPDSGGPHLVYGNLVVGGSPCAQTGTFGISFSPAGYTNTGGGTWWFVQLINSQSITFNGTPASCTVGKDGPYPNATAPPAPDAPFLQLLSSDHSVTRSFNATMYLMWKSSTSSSIPVPIGYQVWGFSGSASCSTSCGTLANWTPTTTGTPGPVGAFVISTAQQSSKGYPTWTGAADCQ